MSIDFGLLINKPVLIVGLVLALLALKSVLNWVLCRLMKVNNVDATRASLLLSQSGEFGFVIFGLASINGILQGELFNVLTLLVALTMAATPLMVRLSDLLTQLIDPSERTHDVSTTDLGTAGPHVIIAGFGRVGHRIAKILQAAS